MSDLKLQAVISVANKASAPLRAINSDLNKLRSPIRGLSRQIKALDRSSGFKEMRKGVAGLASQLGRLGIIGAGAATAGFVALNKMAQTGDEIIKTATNFDISTDAIQEWRFVAERSGVSVATINKSMQAFTKRLAEARNGTGELSGLLRKVNPQFLEQVLAIDNNADAYAFMIKSMAKLPDQQRQILLGDKAFSEAGRELVKITANGADEIDRLRKSAHEYGAVLDKSVLEQSASFQDEMTNMSSIVSGIAFAVGAELLPEVKNLMIELKEWYLLNQDVIKTDVAAFAKKAAAGIKEFTTWVKAVAPDIANFIDGIGGLKTVAIGLGLVIAGPLLSAVVALGAALAATPLGWISLAVAGAVALYKNFEPFQRLIDSIISSFKSFLTLSSSVGSSISSFFGGNDSQVKPSAGFTTKKQSTLGFGSGVSGRGFRVKPFKPNVLAAQSQQKADVGGKIQLEIKSDSFVSVKKLQSNNPNVSFDVDAGMSMVGG